MTNGTKRQGQIKNARIKIMKSNDVSKCKQLYILVNQMVVIVKAYYVSRLPRNRISKVLWKDLSALRTFWQLNDLSNEAE